MKKKFRQSKKMYHFFIVFLSIVICAATIWGLFIQSPSALVATNRKQNKINYDDTLIKQKETDSEGSDINKKNQINQSSVILYDVPYINQRERYPTGCESVSTVMALNYLGIDITVDDFIDNYLDMGSVPAKNLFGEKFGCDPWKAFPGNPYTNNGYGCFAPVIVNAVNKFINNNKFEVHQLYNKPIEELCNKYIDKGIPVIFWATINMKPAQAGNSWTDKATGKHIDWVIPMHCMLLIGYDEDFYYFNDPWQQKACTYSKEEVTAAYEAMHSQAVVIKPKQ